MRIMVADQDVEYRRSLVGYLTTLNHSIEEALTSRDVIEHCRSKCPDLLFIDINLSGTSGVELIRQVRQLGGHAVWAPIVLIGKELSDKDISSALDAGADDFLIKPIPTLKILAKARSAERHKNLKEEVFTVAHSLVVANRALESVMTQDVLTGIANANSFDEALEKDWFKAKNANQPLAIILGNIDYFRAYNDAYGAEQGDRTIKQVADVLKKTCTDQNQVLARLIGDTFGILLPNTDREGALQIAENLRQAIEGLKIPHIKSGNSDHLTMSFGVSVTGPVNYTQPWDLKETADFALYQAKHYGRNRSYLVPITKETTE